MHRRTVAPPYPSPSNSSFTASLQSHSILYLNECLLVSSQSNDGHLMHTAGDSEPL